jgi:tetratricopeptide (TPR) repeat protein
VRHGTDRLTSRYNRRVALKGELVHREECARLAPERQHVSQTKMSHPKHEWNDLLKSRYIGPASQLEHARRYTNAHPTEFAGWIVLADALWKMARYAEAKRALRSAERVVPSERRWQVWEQWGRLYREMHDLRRSEAWYRKAVRARPSTSGHIFLGAVLALQGKRDDAEREHRAAIAQAAPNEPIDEAHFNVALILRSKESYFEAMRHLREALKIDPNYAAALDVLRDLKRAMRLAPKPLQPTSGAARTGRTRKTGSAAGDASR